MPRKKSTSTKNKKRESWWGNDKVPYLDPPPHPAMGKDAMDDWINRNTAASDPWAAVDAIVKREAEPTGPEWFTAEQFADRYKLSARQAWAVCNGLVRQGKLRHWKGTSLTTRRVTNKDAPA